MSTKGDTTTPAIAPRARAFLDYWSRYRGDVDELTARARRIALRDGRPIVCLNDTEAAWTQLIGPLWVHR